MWAQHRVSFALLFWRCQSLQDVWWAHSIYACCQIEYVSYPYAAKDSPTQNRAHCGTGRRRNARIAEPHDMLCDICIERITMDIRTAKYRQWKWIHPR
ncbi:hypothetical protein FN846DRAFT_208522 [Sphaerosporella brunnea]|uniref:Secreted protein n=1 Tax=Sphaerosporella brunnea TaxID=1250544 RepID=A0A5J5EP42_9PEZI|nr:hypothetical protein FN846DRAFT_208522 [Sphaerosporella brunnea]